MNDMSQVIIPRSDQINADTLLAGPMTVTIREVHISGGQEQPVSIALEETPLFFRPCKSMSRCLVTAWGPDAKAYIGRSLTLYRDPTVKWGGLEVGGIRISHMTHIDSKMVMQLTATKGQRKPHVVIPLAASDTKADKAADGVRTLVARINSVDPKNLAGIVDDPVVIKQRAWLADKRPELAAEIERAIEAKAVPGDDDPFAEGPADEDRGDGFTDDDQHPALKTANEIRAQMEAAQDKQTYNVILAEWNKHKTAIQAHDEALAVDVNNAILIAAQRLGV